jgi:hypothetical protein
LSRRRPFEPSFAKLRAAAFALFACGTACSLILKDEPVHCTTDADCAKLTGARCDVNQNECVSGAAEPHSGDGDDASIAPTDGAPLAADAGDGATDDGADGPTTTTDAAVDAPDVAPPVDGGRTQPDWTLVSTYLQSLYDPTQSLLRRSPGSTAFWTSNDNILAARALAYLPTPVTAMSQSILTRLAGLHTCGCGDNFGHTADFNHLVDPVVHKGATTPIVPNGACFGQPSEIGSCSAGFDAGGAIVCSAAEIRTEDHADLGWGPDSCHPTPCGGSKFQHWNDPGQGSGLADLIALEIFNYRNRKMDTSGLWANLAGKWDGKGMRDAITGGDSSFATYKLALFKLAARVLGKPLPPGVDETLAAAQGPNGGIRSSYGLDGSFSIDQAGTTETTAYVVIAYLKPLNEF